MSGVRMPISDADLAASARQFAADIEGAKDRWLYCLSRVKRQQSFRGRPCTTYAPAAVKICERILGASVYASPMRFAQLDELGYEGAVAKSRTILGKVPFSVDPLEAWHVGHVYFARVSSHPHVLKIGFSRRVRDRLEDVASKSRTNLEIRPQHIKVGTMADERWWHDHWKAVRIEGEWFFDPHMADRTLPDFLQQKAEAA
jgi:hypothetical protein